MGLRLGERDTEAGLKQSKCSAADVKTSDSLLHPCVSMGVCA